MRLLQKDNSVPKEEKEVYLPRRKKKQKKGGDNLPKSIPGSRKEIFLFFWLLN